MRKIQRQWHLYSATGIRRDETRLIITLLLCYVLWSIKECRNEFQCKMSRYPGRPKPDNFSVRLTVRTHNKDPLGLPSLWADICADKTVNNFNLIRLLRQKTNVHIRIIHLLQKLRTLTYVVFVLVNEAYKLICGERELPTNYVFLI